MIEMMLKFNSMKDIEDFHRVACKMNCDVDALKGSYIVDAKSFMVMFSLDYRKQLRVTADCEEAEFEAFHRQVKEALGN
jgi:hypothetical protein